jgi:hypothetical protein
VIDQGRYRISRIVIPNDAPLTRVELAIPVVQEPLSIGKSPIPVVREQLPTAEMML